MRRRLIVGNLKMQWKGLADANQYVEVWQSLNVSVEEQKELVVCPSFVFLETVGRQLPEGAVLGAQDVFWEDVGAYTGEVSPASLADLGVRYVIVGHSERRKWLGETDEMIGKKVVTAIRGGLRPILCVGETQEEHESGQAQEVVRKQLERGLVGIDEQQATGVVVAYEPRWAIGTDVVPSLDEIRVMSRDIRSFLLERFGSETGEMIPVLYGGSVSTENFHSLCIDSGMDGALVGRESLEPEKLLAMYREV